MKKSYVFYWVNIIVGIIILISCEDEKEMQIQSNKIEIVDLSVANVSYKNATVVSKIPNNYNVEIDEYGHCWSTDSLPSIDDSVTIFSDYSNFEFTSNLEGLQHNTTYYVRTYIKFDDIVRYDSLISFKTLEIKPPAIGSFGYSKLRAKTASLSVKVDDFSMFPTDSAGFCWSIEKNPTINNENVLGILGVNGLYVCDIKDLIIDTEYFFRAYAANEAGVVYSDELVFTTKDGIPKFDVQNIGPTAISNRFMGEVNDDGGFDIIEFGICYNEVGNPTINDTVRVTSLDNNSFDYSITQLKPNTTYYFKAYVLNEMGAHYGNEEISTTLDSLAVLGTLDVIDITASSAKCGGEILYTNGVDIIEKGVCYNTLGNPTVDDTKIISSVEYGSYQSELIGLQRSTNYYVCAYAINEFGVSYGEERQFVTGDGAPVLYTKDLSEITLTSLKSGGEIVSDEGLPITEKGLCWNNYGNPTVGDIKQESGSEFDDFSITLENLTQGQTFYLRAYAMNSNGVGYGDELNITLTEDNISIQDIDGNCYNVVKIGNQIWMKENLKTTHYADGTKISKGTEISGLNVTDRYWMSPIKSENGEEADKDTYGLLYTWAAATNGGLSSNSNPSNIQGVCPDGWHIPSDSEWDELASLFGGGIMNVGGPLKEIGFNHWNYPNVGATNESGFAAVPSGKISDDYHSPVGKYAYFWTATEHNSDSSAYRACSYSYASLWHQYHHKTSYFSIRCVKNK